MSTAAKANMKVSQNKTAGKSHAEHAKSGGKHHGDVHGDGKKAAHSPGVVGKKQKAVIKHLGDVQQAVRKGVKRAAEIVSQIRAAEAAVRGSSVGASMKVDSKTDMVTLTLPPDRKDLTILQNSLDFLRSEMRALTQEIVFSEHLTDAPAQITATGGGLVGSTLYWNDFQANSLFASWIVLFDQARLDQVITWINGAAINGTTTGTNLNALWVAADIDETGSSSVGQSTPTVGTIVKYPYKGIGSKLFEPHVPTPNGSNNLGKWISTMSEMPKGPSGVASSSVIRVYMGTWINANGNAAVVAGCHKFAADVTAYPSSIVLVYNRTYRVSFANVAA